jgi:hypothetical protein
VVASLCLLPCRSVSQAPPGWTAVADHAGADSVRGRRLRFRAFVHTKLAEGTAALWMRVDGPGLQDVVAFDNMNERPIIGDTPWTPYGVVLDVPAESSVITFGLSVEGRGQVWLDEVQLEVVDAKVPSTNMDDALAKMQGETSPAPSLEERDRILASRRRAPRWPVNLGFEQRP